jgi:hypothetical protein
MKPKTSRYCWVIVSTLSVTETISWGILYYAFGILQAPMEREMGWSSAECTAAFSTILTLAAGLASTIFDPISSMLVASLIDVTRSASASGVEDARAAPIPIRLFMERS